MPHYALLAGFEPERVPDYTGVVSGQGLESVVASDGAEARSLLKERGTPDLLLTELSLAHADGFTLLGELRAAAPAERTPAIVVSGFPEFRETALSMQDQLGIAAVLPADAAVETVGSAVKRALAGKKPVAAPDGKDEKLEALLRDETARLSVIESMRIVDERPPDHDLQELVEETAHAFHVPIALVSIILKDRQWFKAYYGLPEEVAAARETPRELSFCRHIVEGDHPGPLVVPDAQKHPVFASNPMVKQGIVGSYAGAPLVTPEGHVLGTLCIIDSKPLGIGKADLDHLCVLARRVAGELEMRSMAAHQAAEIRELKRRLEQGKPGPEGLAAWLPLIDGISASFDSGLVIIDQHRRIVFASRTLGDMFDLPQDRLVGLSRDDFVLRIAKLSDRPADCVRSLGAPEMGPFAVRCEFVVHRPDRRVIRWTARPVTLPGGTGEVEMFSDLSGEMERALRTTRTTATRPG